jgi:ribosomal protein S19E (S16A)
MTMQLKSYRQAKIPDAADGKQLGSETNRILIERIAEIARIEGPVHRDVVIDRIRKSYGLERVRGSTRTRVQKSISNAVRRKIVKGDKRFIWFKNSQLSRSPRKAPDENFDHIAPMELRAIVLRTADLSFGSTRHELVVQTARILGFTRTGKRINGVVNDTIQQLLSDGKLKESFGNILPVVEF